MSAVGHEATPGRPARPRATRVLAAVAALSLAATAAVTVAEPRVGIMEYDDLREGQLEAAGAVVMTLLGGVVLGRLRRDRSRRSLLLGTALLVLAAASLFASVATPVVDALSRSTFATWTVAGGGALGALLLVSAAVLPERAVQGRGAAARALAAGGLALAAIALAGALVGDRLPVAFERLPSSAEEVRAGTAHPALLAVELLTAAGCAAAAWRLAVLADGEGDALWRWMAVGVGLIAVAFANYALVPSQFTELLYAGDLFLLVAIAVLLAGALVEITSTEAALVRSAVTSERTRVADELRAGIAQELALMSLQTRTFAGRPADRPPLEQLAWSVERALDESRGAIAALARPVDEPLAVAVGEAARDAAAHVGAHVELDLDPGADAGRESRDGLVRLTRDAVTVAARHRGATRIRVQLRGGQHVTLRVSDDGRPAGEAAGGSQAAVWLGALRERAAALGATCTISAAAGGGTVVDVALS